MTQTYIFSNFSYKCVEGIILEREKYQMEKLKETGFVYHPNVVTLIYNV